MLAHPSCQCSCRGLMALLLRMTSRHFVFKFAVEMSIGILPRKQPTKIEAMHHPSKVWLVVLFSTDVRPHTKSKDFNVVHGCFGPNSLSMSKSKSWKSESRETNRRCLNFPAVSYTHLTLPTIYSV